MTDTKILLIVDPQVDFITGSLPVSGADKAMDALAEYVKDHGNDYAVKLVTSDWHPYNHSSFDRRGGSWPAHCVQHSMGAAVWPSLLEALNQSRGGFTMLYKGMKVEREEYSIMQNEASAEVILKLVAALHADVVDVCGVAGDVCVLNTAQDLVKQLGAQHVNVLQQYAPSLDGGAKLQAWVESTLR